MVDGVLFDMDGTLVDSTVVVEQMWTEFAHEVGVDAAEVVEFAHGRPSRETIAKYAPDAQDEWNARFTEGEATRFDDVVEIPGAAAFANSLPRGRWALVTSALHHPARARLKAIGIEPPEVVIGAEDVERGKPDPEGYRKAAALLGLDPARCVVFEDTDAGMTAGLEAGCVVIAMGDREGHELPVAGRIPDMTHIRAKVAADGILICGVDAEGSLVDVRDRLNAFQ